MNVLLGNLGTGVNVSGIYTDYSDGDLKRTDNKLDFAIAGDGFFTVMTPQGERYTRDGSFSITATGDLVTKDGFQVMGKRGAVNLTSSNIVVNEDGSIVQDGQVINELRIVSANDPLGLKKIGRNLFVLKDGAGVADLNGNFRVMQGFTESSNVNVVAEMVEMISGLRLYEASQKLIQSQDETLGRLIDDVGTV
jgi:flagellar basal-body rod protein FlgG